MTIHIFLLDNSIDTLAASELMKKKLQGLHAEAIVLSNWYELPGRCFENLDISEFNKIFFCGRISMTERVAVSFAASFDLEYLSYFSVAGKAAVQNVIIINSASTSFEAKSSVNEEEYAGYVARGLKYFDYDQVKVDVVAYQKENAAQPLSLPASLTGPAIKSLPMGGEGAGLDTRPPGQDQDLLEAVQAALWELENNLNLEISILEARRTNPYLCLFSYFTNYEIQTKQKKLACVQNIVAATDLAHIKSRATAALSNVDGRVHRQYLNTASLNLGVSRTTALLKKIVNDPDGILKAYREKLEAENQRVQVQPG